MSNTIDRKVVEMQFDNSQFEKNVRGSMSTIEKLKASLKFDGLTKGFDELDKKSKKVDFSPMSSALDTVSRKFSALEAVALGSLMRIGQRAIDAGIKLGRSLSTDNIVAGWSKFEEKTKSVGTLIAQGFDAEEVNKQLARLNSFTDETSYSFTNMVAEIAKFTATGKGLEDSVDALMGIANWAAVSGQNAATANRAMYQLSQAMGAGVMRKEDYKSIQNVSMDTKEFRQRALDAGVALGTLKKNANGTYTSIVKGAKRSTFTISQFADHLTQEAWFTSDVMMKVYKEYGYAVDVIDEYIEAGAETASKAIELIEKDLKKGTGIAAKYDKELLEFGIKAYKAAQEARSWGDTVESVKEAVASGFMRTFEIIFGEYDEAVDLWTDLANRFYEEFATPINNFNDMLERALKSNEPYIDEYFKKLTGSEDEVLQKAIKITERFGYNSEAGYNAILHLVGGNKELANTISDFIKLNHLAGEGEKVVGASVDSVIEYAAELYKVSKEDVAALKKIGDTYGYKSAEYIREQEKIFGYKKNGIYETVAGLLAAGKGIDVIEKKDLDSYLENTLNLTTEQVEKLHELADTYGANSDEVDKYITSLHKMTNFDYGNRGWTKNAIKALLELTNGVGKATLSWGKGDFAAYVADITGTSEEAASGLYELLKLREELTSATEQDTEAIEENEKAIKNQLNEITHGNKALNERILNIFNTQKDVEDKKGYRNLLVALRNIWDYVKKIKDTVKEAFNEVFGRGNEKTIYSITERIREFSERLDFNSEKAEKVKRAFKGVFSIFKIIGQIVKPILIPIKAFFSELIGGTEGLGEGVATIGDWITNLAESGIVAEKATKFFTALGEVIRPVARMLRNLFNFSEIKKTFQTAGGGIKGVISVISRAIKTVVGGIFDVISEITGWDVSDVKEKVLNFLERVNDIIGNILPKQGDLKDGFEKIKSVVSDVFSYLGFGSKKDTSGIDDATTAVGGFSDAVGNTVTNLDILGTNLGNFFGGFKDVTETITEASDTVKSSGILTGFSGSISKIKTNLDKVDFADVFDKLLDGGKIAGLLMFSKSFLDIGKGFKEAGKGIKSFGDGFAANGIFGKDSIFKRETKDWTVKVKRIAEAILFLAAALLLISKVPSDRVWQCTGVLGALLGMMVIAYKVMEMGDKKNGSKSTVGMVGFAIGILILVKAVSKIAEIDQNTVWNATLVIMALMGTLAVSMFIMNFKASKGSIGRTIELVVLVLMVKQLAEVVVSLLKTGATPEEMWHAAGIVAALTVVIGLSMLLMNSSKGGGIKAIAGGIGALLLVQAVKNVAIVISELSKSVSNGAFKTATGVVLAAIVVIGLMMVLFDALDPKKILAGSGAMLIMSISIGIIAGSLSHLAKIDSGSLMTAAVALGIIVVAMGLVLGILAQIPPMYLLAASGAFLIFSASIIVLSLGLIGFANVIKKFSKIASGDFWKAIGFIAAGLGVIGLAFLIISPVVPVILIFAGAMLMLSSALVVAGKGIGFIGTGLAKLAIGILSFTAIMNTCKEDFVDSLDFLLDRFGKSIPKIAGSIVALPIEIGKEINRRSSEVNEVIRGLVKNLIDAALGVVNDNLIPITDTVLNLAIQLLDKLIEKGPELVDKLLELLIILLHGISQKIERIVDEVFNILIGILNGISNNIGTLIAKVFEIVEKIVNGAIEGLNNMDLPPIEDIMNAMVKLHEMMLLLGSFTFTAPFAGVGAIAAASFVTEVITLLGLFGGINELLPDLQDFVKSGADLVGTAMEAIGSIIGRFFGAILGEIAATLLTTVSEALPGIGENLSDFYTNGKDFFDGVKDWSPEMFAPFKALIEALIDITKNEVVTKIIELFTGKGSTIKDFIRSVNGMGDALQAWITKIRKIDMNEEDVARATHAAGIVRQLAGVAADLPNLFEGIHKSYEKVSSDGTVEKSSLVIGKEKQDLSSFAKGVGDLADGIALFAEKTKDIPVPDEGVVDGISRAISIIRDLEDVANGLPNLVLGIRSSFSVAAENVQISGEAAAGVVKQDLANFAAAVGELGEGIALFVEKTKDIPVPDEGVVDGVSRAISIIRDLEGVANGLPELLKGFEGSFYADAGNVISITGEAVAGVKKQDTQDFAVGISRLSEGINAFIESTKDITEDDKKSADLAVEIVNDIVEIANALPNVFEGFKASSDVDPVTSAIGAAAGALTNPGTGLIGALVFGGSKEIESGVEKLDLQAFAGSVTLLGEGISSFVNNIRGLKLTKEERENYIALLTAVSDILFIFNVGEYDNTTLDDLERVSYLIGEFLKSFDGYDTTDIDKVAESLRAFDDVIKSITSGHDFTTINAFLWTFAISGFKNNVEENVAALANAYDPDNNSLLYENLSGLADKASETLRGFRTKFRDAGRYCADGFILGLGDRKPNAKKAAEQFGNAVEEGLENSLEIESPSKRSAGAARFFIAGFVNVLDTMRSSVYDSSEDLGQGALEGLRDALSGSETGLDGFDNTITIKPVIDLSEIQNGTDAIGGMLGGLDGFTLGGSLKFGRQALNSMNRNDDSDDENFDRVIKEIEKIGDKLEIPEQNNTFNISGSDTDEIVNEVVKRLTKLVLRRGREWA